MNLYLFQLKLDPWNIFIVRGIDEIDARLRASARHGDEGGAVWLDSTQSECIEFEDDGEAGILMIV